MPRQMALPVGIDEVWSPEALRAEAGCPYEFAEGKHEGGCGHGKAPKGYDTRNGCLRLTEERLCPIQEVRL